MKIYLAHHKQATNDHIARNQREIGVLLAEANKDVEIAPARAYVKDAKTDSIGWDKFTQQVVDEFDGLVVISLHIGKATQRLVNMMRIKNKPVQFYNGQNLCEITGVKTLDQTDTMSGWMVIYKKQ